MAERAVIIEGSRESLAHLVLNVPNDDLRAVLHEQLRGRSADTRRSAGDYCNLALELQTLTPM